MQTVAELTAEFSIEDVLRFDEPHAGMVRAVVTTPACSAEIYLQGAHVAGWQPVGAEPVIFMSSASEFKPGTPIRGGVPVIFPWFGARSATPASDRTDGPSHGFARTTVWTLSFVAMVSDELHMTFALGPDETSRAAGYDAFRVAYTVVFGASLSMRLSVANDAAAALYFEEALHTYLRVGDVAQIGMLGLGATEYLDKMDGFKRKRQDEDVLRLVSGTDRPYLNTAATVVIEDTVLKRKLVCVKTNSMTTVVWNPWEDGAKKLHDLGDEDWHHFVCCEAANAGENRVTLEAKSVRVMEQKISVEAV